MPDGPVTLEHVAQAAGVSPSTASRALAGKARECRISPSTEQAILQAAKGLGFQASHVARSLRMQKTGLIGLLVPDASNPFFSAIARKATVHAERQGLSTLLADSHDSLDHERDLLAHLKSRQVEGLIICPIGDSSSHLGWLSRSRANVVVVDRWFADLQLTTVTSENEVGAEIATQAMIERGHRRIGCLQGRPGTSSNDERLQGFQKALRAANIKPDPALICGDDFSESSGYRSTCELLDEHPDLTGLFSLSNMNALGVLRALAERSLKVPHDISLVTFDDAPFAEYLASPLSVVRQDIETIGHVAAELLIEQIRTGQKPKQLLHRVPVEFVARDSIGPPRS
jgi:LacI family transcriptional regulator, galactose operon repressor